MYSVGYKPCYDSCSQIVLTTGCLINKKNWTDGRRRADCSNDSYNDGGQ